jgi:hypothetical protein
MLTGRQKYLRIAKFFGIAAIFSLVMVFVFSVLWYEPRTLGDNNSQWAIIISVSSLVVTTIGTVSSVVLGIRQDRREQRNEKKVANETKNYSEIKSIFISYRRSDSPSATHTLHNLLVDNLGENRVFIDLDDIPYGARFSDLIEKEVGLCDAAVAVIGPRWLETMGEDGRRRLDDPDDWVRKELTMLLARKIPLIPALVDGANLPVEEELPTPLKGLNHMNAITIMPDAFHSGVKEMLESLNFQLGGRRPIQA